MYSIFAVNTKSFLVKKEEDIREDELFFHRYCLKCSSTHFKRVLSVVLSLGFL